MEAPSTLPSEFVEMAHKLKQVSTRAHRIKVHNKTRYVYVVQPDYINNWVPNSWVTEFENARAGQIPARWSYERVHKVCHGLARVH